MDRCGEETTVSELFFLSFFFSVRFGGFSFLIYLILYLSYFQSVHIIGESVKTTVGRLKILEEWKENGGILVIGFEMFCNLSMAKRVKDPEVKARFLKCLTEVPDLLFVDEGHRIKNDKANLSRLLKQIKTTR